MKSAELWATYEDRMNRVVAYIHDHLDDDLDLNSLAEIACLSPHHWHRVYTAIKGETIAATVKRLRLQRAAYALAHTTDDVDAIAKRNGYANAQSFTRAFSQSYRMPPGEYRKHGSHAMYRPENIERNTKMYDVEIKTLPATNLIYVSQIGSYMNTGAAYERLFGAMASQGLIGVAPKLVAVYYDDPDAVAEAELRSRAGVVSEAETDVAAPLERMTLSGGSFAVLRHKGPYVDLKPAYNWFFGEWLAASGRELRDEPCFEEYLNSPQDTPPMELLTNIHMPLVM